VGVPTQSGVGKRRAKVQKRSGRKVCRKEAEAVIALNARQKMGDNSEEGNPEKLLWTEAANHSIGDPEGVRTMEKGTRGRRPIKIN